MRANVLSTSNTMLHMYFAMISSESKYMRNKKDEPDVVPTLQYIWQSILAVQTVGIGSTPAQPENEVGESDCKSNYSSVW